VQPALECKKKSCVIRFVSFLMVYQKVLLQHKIHFDDGGSVLPSLLVSSVVRHDVCVLLSFQEARWIHSARQKIDTYEKKGFVSSLSHFFISAQEWSTVRTPLFCPFCAVQTPIRTHHCRRCNRCVGRFDHQFRSLFVFFCGFKLFFTAAHGLMDVLDTKTITCSFRWFSEERLDT
jgi:hypothetical protein